MDIVNDTVSFFENPLENKNLLLNHSITSGGKTFNIDNIRVQDDMVFIETEDYQPVDEETGEPVGKPVYKVIESFNMKDPSQQAVLAQDLQRAAGGNNKDNNEVIAMFRRLYPEVYKKRQVELSKTASKNNVPTGFAFKDQKAYNNWKDKHPLDEEGKQYLRTNKKLIAAQAAVDAAGIDPIARSMAQKEFMELEYEIYQEALIQGSLNKLQG